MEAWNYKKSHKKVVIGTVAAIALGVSGCDASSSANAPRGTVRSANNTLDDPSRNTSTFNVTQETSQSAQTPKMPESSASSAYAAGLVSPAAAKIVKETVSLMNSHDSTVRVSQNDPSTEVITRKVGNNTITVVVAASRANSFDAADISSLDFTYAPPAVGSANPPTYEIVQSTDHIGNQVFNWISRADDSNQSFDDAGTLHDFNNSVKCTLPIEQAQPLMAQVQQAEEAMLQGREPVMPNATC